MTHLFSSCKQAHTKILGPSPVSALRAQLWVTSDSAVSRKQSEACGTSVEFIPAHDRHPASHNEQHKGCLFHQDALICNPEVA